MSDHENHSPALRCKDLSTAEMLALMPVRLSAYGTQRLQASAVGTLQRAPASEASEIVGNLAGAFTRSPLAGAALRRGKDPWVSPAEFDLLTALAWQQQGGDVEEVSCHWGWPAAREVAFVDDTLRRYAHWLGGSGTVLPPAKERPVLASLEALRVSELDYREEIVLQAVRAWVVAFMNDGNALTALRASLEEAEVIELVPPLHAIMSNTAIAATRKVEINCPRCTNLSRDERRLLHAISASQRGRTMEVSGVLSTWLPPSAVRLTAPAAEGAGMALSASDHRLPLRVWNLPEVNGVSASPAVGEDQHRVH